MKANIPTNSFFTLALLLVFGCQDRSSFHPVVDQTLYPVYFNGIVSTFDDPSFGATQTSTGAAIERNVDKNKSEFPDSLTSLSLLTVPGGYDGNGRALKVDFSMPVPEPTRYHRTNHPDSFIAESPLYIHPDDRTVGNGFTEATCPSCHCAGFAGQYGYSSITLNLANSSLDTYDLSAFTHIVFRVKSSRPFPYSVTIACPAYVPLPSEMLTKTNLRNLCIPIQKNEMKYSATSPSNIYRVAGTGDWEVMRIPLAGFLASGTCDFSMASSISFGITTSNPVTTADHPDPSGTFYLDHFKFE